MQDLHRETLYERSAYHGLSSCMMESPPAKVCDLSLSTAGRTFVYLSLRLRQQDMHIRKSVMQSVRNINI